MENSEEISIDTNIFITMIEFYRDSKGLSESEVISKIDGLKVLYEKLEENFKKYKNVYKFPEDSKLQSLIDHLESLKNGFNNNITNLTRLISNNNFLSEKVILDKKINIENSRNEFYKISKEKNQLEVLKKLRNNRHVYELLKDVLLGKKDICLVDVAAKEVDRHIIEKKDNYEEPPYEEFFYMSQEESDFLLKKCTLVSYEDHASNKLLNELVNILQGENSPILEKLKMEPFERAMDNDKNSNKVFGDALILVESNLAGLPFTSLNKKDFFADYEIEGVDKDLDDTIRQRIEHIMKKVPLFSNAPLYKVNELMDENRQRVKIVSPITETVELSEKDKEERKEDKAKDEKDKKKKIEIEYDKFKQVIVKKVKDKVVDEMLGPQM